jgi:hypothetical protein
MYFKPIVFYKLYISKNKSGFVVLLVRSLEYLCGNSDDWIDFLSVS